MLQAKLYACDNAKCPFVRPEEEPSDVPRLYHRACEVEGVVDGLGIPVFLNDYPLLSSFCRKQCMESVFRRRGADPPRSNMMNGRCGHCDMFDVDGWAVGPLGAGTFCVLCSAAYARGELEGQGPWRDYVPVL